MKPYFDNCSTMAPSRKRGFLPLSLVLSVSCLFLFSLYRSFSPSSAGLSSSDSSIASSFSLNSPDYNNNSLTSPTNPNSRSSFTFTIKVLAYNRIASVSRCLISLANADYGQDRVNLHIFMDHFQDSKIYSVSVDEKLKQSREILDFVDGFSWRFGEKLVHYRTTNVGLQAQWLEAWWPSSDREEFAFVVEDDLEVSPLYYKFLRGLILNYYFNASNFHPSIYGASLQRPRFVPGKHGNKLKLDNDTRLFLYQLVGTWGQLLFPRPWKEFRLWYDIHKAKEIRPILQGMVTTGWYKKMGERIWTPWFIKFIHSRGYFNLYTNFQHERALSISHRDAGVNYGKTAGPDSYLLDENSSLDFKLMEMEPLSKLQWYDFCFRLVVPGRVVRSSIELGPVLRSQQKQATIILVSLLKVSQAVARNLLCHFERLNIQNYILVGPKSDFLLDLARRGHPVIDVDQFLDNMRADKLMDFQEPGTELIKEILVNAYSVKKAVELGYSIWVIDGNVLPVSGNLFLDSADPRYGFYVGNSFRVFFARSSSFTKKHWGEDFVNKVLVLKPLKVKGSNGQNFAQVAARVLEEKGVEVKSLDGWFWSDLEINSSIRIMPRSLSDGKKLVLWSSEMGLDLIQKHLAELGLWVIDSEFSCTAVVCHQS